MSKSKIDLLEERLKNIEDKFKESYEKYKLENAVYNLNNYFKNNIIPENLQEQKLLKSMKDLEELKINIIHLENHLDLLTYRFGKNITPDSIADEISNSFKDISNKYLDYVWGKQKLYMELLEYTYYDEVK